jgi:hypothetical protein
MRRKTEIIADDLYNESDRISGLLSEAARRLAVLSRLEAAGAEISTKLESAEDSLSLIEQITALSTEWGGLICGDHKDSDCHWSIETRWSYGDAPKYTIHHYGNIWPYEINAKYNTYPEAVMGLKLVLEDAVQDLQAQQIKRTTATASAGT